MPQEPDELAELEDELRRNRAVHAAKDCGEWGLTARGSPHLGPEVAMNCLAGEETRIAVQRLVGKAIGGEQAALDLQFRGTILLCGDPAIAEVARQLVELRAIECERCLASIAGGIFLGA